MRVCSLSSVKNRIVLGAPLPFSVRDNGHHLLLARGQIIADEAQLEELFQRGALVEVDELRESMQPAGAQKATKQAAARQTTEKQRAAKQLAGLPSEWDQSNSEARQALTAAVPEMAEAIHGATDLLLGLIERAPDVALSQVVRQHEAGVEHYGVSHSVHAATACQAAARHLGWSAEEQRRAFQAALTMNLGMIDLQAKLATQVSPPTAKQREAIKEHPLRSAEILVAAGIEDEAWLDAVRLHHEVPDGTGYPRGTTACSELSELLRFADIYTALLSSRANRPAMSAQQAGRELYQVAAESPLCAALIKAFGIFPPGSIVRLASGEMGVVTRNGDKAYHPMVAALTDTAGAPRLEPLMRDTAHEKHAITAVLSAQAMPMRLTDVRIAGIIGGA